MKQMKILWKLFMVFVLVFAVSLVASCEFPGGDDPVDPIEVKNFTINFDSDGGSSVSSITLKANEVITKPNDPTKDGYTFVGWEPEIPESMPENNLTVKAKWEANSYKITLEPNGGELTNKEISVKYKENYSLPTLEREGYNFLGWFDGDKEVKDGVYDLTKDLTLEAKWEKIVVKYTIHFDTDGGSNVNDITLEAGDNITVNAPTKEGYTFDGWEPALPNVMPENDLTVKAKWVVNNYTIHFDTNGGSSISDIILEFGEAISEIVAPTREGYAFDGWEKEVPSTMPATDLTLKAKWVANKYKVTLDVAGGNDLSETEIVIAYDGQLSLPTPTRSGYVFKGWYNGSDKVEDGKWNRLEDLALVASWEVRTYIITFDSKGGVLENNTLTVTRGSEYVLPTPTKKGYIFVGWFNGEEIFEDGVWYAAGDVVLTASWENRKYTITFDVNGGNSLESSTMTVSYRETVSLPFPTKEAGIFAGWYNGSEEVSGGTWEIDEDVTLVAKWNPKRVTTITITDKEDVIEVLDTFYLGYTYTDLDAVVEKVTYSSSNTKVAMVDENGLVKGVGVGLSLITIDVDGIKAEYALRVIAYRVPATEITLNHAREWLIVGETDQLGFTVAPEGASDFVIWSYSTSGIVSVDSNNVITALRSGEVEITVETKKTPTVSDSYVLTVYDPIYGMTIVGSKGMKPSQEQQLSVEIDDEYEGNPVSSHNYVTWSSSNSEVVTVDENGYVTAVGEGSAVITATSIDSLGTKATFGITVLEADIILNDVNYYSMASALFVAEEGDTIYISNGTINEQFTISTNDITLVGDNVTFKKPIVIVNGVDGLTITGITFANNGYIYTESGNVGVSNILISNCTFDSVSTGSEDATIHFYTTVEGFQFVNNTATFKSNRGIRFEQDAKDINIYGNSFTGITGTGLGNLTDMIRGMQLVYGSVDIVKNTFDTTLQSHIFINRVGPGHYNINRNRFMNANSVCLDLREAKTATLESNIVIDIIKNDFIGGNNSWGTIRVRNSYTSGALSDPTQVEVTINRNKFTGISLSNSGGYYVDKPTARCTEGLFNIDNNYSDLGQPQASWFSGMAASFADWADTPDGVENLTFLEQIDEYDSFLVVGTHPEVFKEGYDTLADALAAANAGDTIVLLPGNHEGNATISKNNITITSLNRNLNPNESNERYDEATYNGKITLAAGLIGLTINGIKFIEGASIVNNAGAAGTSTNTATNLDHFTFINNIVESAATGTGFIYFVEGSSSYSHDIIITNNYFKSVTGYSATGMVYIDNNYDLTVEGNVFENITGTYAFYIKDKTKGMSGQFSNINDNVFRNISGSGIWINYLSPLPLNTATCRVSVQRNTFENVGEQCIHLGTMNNTDRYEYIKICHNVFNQGVKIGVHCDVVKYGARISCEYNRFNAIPSSAYFENGTPTGVHINAMNCEFYDGSTPISAPTESGVAFTYIELINKSPDYKVVGTYPGITKEGYASLSAAISAASSGDTIVLLPGDHTGNVSIASANEYITITSLNRYLNPNESGERYDEATYNGKITLAAGVKYLTISGIKFIEGASIVNTAGSAGSGTSPATNLVRFTFANNIVESAATGTGFIYFVEGSSSYSHDIVITNNYFKSVTGYSATGMVYIDNNYDLTVEGNVFENITGTYAFYINDKTKGMSGQLSNINDNVFRNITLNALWVNWLSPIPNGSNTAKVSISGNLFDNVGGECIHIGSSNNDDMYTYININYNRFRNFTKGMYFKRIVAAANFNAHYNIFETVPGTYYINTADNNAGANYIGTLNATDNLYLDGGVSITPNSSLLLGNMNKTTTITDESQLPPR